MKITEYAKMVGVTPLTARKWFHAGMIEGAYQLPTGTIIVPDPTPTPTTSEKPNRAIVYARVSSSDQRDQVITQASRLTDFAISNGYVVVDTVTEVASGLNDKRPKLTKILQRNDYDLLVVEHKDRLTCFGFNYLETLLGRLGVTIVVVNQSSTDKADLLDDFVAVITSFCARIYGQRRGKRKAVELLEVVNNEAH